MENGHIKSFKDLRAWQEAHKLIIEIYTTTKQFPKDELFGLTNQVRRAGVSVTSNISEGFNRRSEKEKVQFYYMALGSLAETQNQMLIARDVGYLSPEVFAKIEERVIAVQKLLNALIKSIRSD